MSYLNIAEVETATVNLASAHPAICELITLPNLSAEKRTCHALRLGGDAPGSRDCVMVIGGQHAKEWGSCEIILNFAVDLITAFETNTGRAYGGKVFSASQIQQIMNGLHVILFPLVNPDGRMFSQDNIANNAPVPEWRRNRNRNYGDGSFNCIGVDLNRNYDFMFDFNRLFAAVGFVGLDDHCNDVFQGPSPFSEPESKNVKWLLDTNPRTRWFVDLHSGTQNIRTNWGDDQAQSMYPEMNFRNPLFDHQRGVSNDAYEEYVPPDDLVVEATLATRMHDAIFAVRGLDFPAAQDFTFTGAIPGTSKDYAYSRHFVDPSKGKIYGFTIEWGEFHPLWPEMQLIIKDVTAGLIELCSQAPCAGGITAIGLLTPALTFKDVPTGVETSRAAVFSVQSCAAVQLNPSPPVVLAGPGAFSLPLGGGSLPAVPTAEERDVRIWVSFKGQNPGDLTTGTMTVHCPQTGQDFVIPILANSIPQPKVASVLVLDKSGSMDDPSGLPGMKRIDVLHASAPKFVALLPDKDGIGIVAFDEDAHPVMDVTEAGKDPGGMGRANATTAIQLHATNPLGLTAIGDGVEMAHDKLKSVAGYDKKAIVVFTDGIDTASKSIDDILGTGQIDNQVFAIGLGTVWEVDPVALNKLVDRKGGYLLLTGSLGPGSDDQFRLDKYFVQILAGVSNAEVVVDPIGTVPGGTEAKIPFYLAETDYGADVILLSPALAALDFEVETPTGVRLRHGALGGVLGVHYVAGPQMGFYRMTLPVVAGGAGAQSGRWYAVLRASGPGHAVFGSVSIALGVPYSINVHARSSLGMAAHLVQTSYEPGTKLHFRAVLTEIGLPVGGRARVRVEVTRPDGTQVTLGLAETEPGVFEGDTTAPLVGVYPSRFLARGTTLRGSAFTREAIRCGVCFQAVHRGAPSPRVNVGPTGGAALR
jgi:murein tripeptide amidase MpaA